MSGSLAAPLRWLARAFFGLRRAVRAGEPPAAPSPPDPRVDAHPWLAQVLGVLGERYRLGDDTPDGTQVLCRTARARFNPMRVWVRPAEKVVAGDYDVRVHGGKSIEDGRALLDREVGEALAHRGVRPVRESVEEWAGQVITRRYEGAVADPRDAAAAIHFMCQESSQALDVLEVDDA